MMLRQSIAVARRIAIGALLVLATAGCGIKGPLRLPPGATAPPPPPPPAGIELPSSTERRQ
jgi:predicted small lipoprotein YifL